MIRLSEVGRVYLSGKEKTEALKQVSLGFGDQGLVAVLGPSGSGKTTLLSIIGGILTPTSGEMEVDGISVKDFQEKDWVRYRGKTIGFVFQENRMIEYLTVYENMMLAMALAGVIQDERKARTQDLLTKVGLLHKMNKKPQELSRGELQRVAVSRAMVSHPDVLLADEPTESLDDENRQIIISLLKEASENCLVVMVTHQTEIAKQYADRIIRLKAGEVISDEENNAEEILPVLELVGLDAENQQEIIRNTEKEQKISGKISSNLGAKLSMNQLFSITKVKKEVLLLRALGASKIQVENAYLLRHVLTSLIYALIPGAIIGAGTFVLQGTFQPMISCAAYFLAAGILFFIQRMHLLSLTRM